MRSILVRAVACALLAACGGCDATAPTNPPIDDGKIGAEGGVVTSANGAAVLTIPAGALSGRFTVTLVPATTKPVDARFLSTSGFVVAPAMTFATPATLTIQYDQSERPLGSVEQNLGGAQLADGAWSTMPSVAVAVDVAQHEVTMNLGTSGTFGVRWQAPAEACAGAEERQFDFWLGSWAFSAPSAFPGTETVTADPSGCALYEAFTQGAGYVGHSVSFYNRTDAKWYQTYVDSDNFRLTLSGTFADGAMLLYASATERYGWSLIDATKIRYFGEQSNNGGSTWQSLFEALYSK